MNRIAAGTYSPPTGAIINGEFIPIENLKLVKVQINLPEIEVPIPQIITICGDMDLTDINTNLFEEIFGKAINNGPRKRL